MQVKEQTKLGLFKPLRQVKLLLYCTFSSPGPPVLISQSRILGLAPTAESSGLDVWEDLSDDFTKVGCAEWAATGKTLTVLSE